MTTTLDASNLRLKDVQSLLKLTEQLNDSFTSLLSLENLTEFEQQELQVIRNIFREYYSEGKISKGQIKFLFLAPLMKLAGFYHSSIKITLEENIANISVEDEDTNIKGRMDILAVSKTQERIVTTPFWILVIESKNSSFNALEGLPQFLPSLIVGSLIGGSIIIGFALTKSPQPVVQSSVLSESSQIRDQVQDTPTPAQSPVSITPEPTASKEPQDQEVSPVRSQPPSNNVPIPTESAQLPSSTQPQIDRLTPEQAVQNYFETVNKRDFQTGWNQLSPSYQNNKRRNPDGYISYIEWWGERLKM
ncbi:MAG: hypothetical protein ACYTXY_01345 [Nostoc sp.]